MTAKYFAALFLFAVLFTSSAAAQTGLPRLKKGERYSSVRSKMLKAGWKPFRAADADECIDNDSRCVGRREMRSCSGTGVGACAFTWKRRGKIVSVFTVGEDGGRYSDYRFWKGTDASKN